MKIELHLYATLAKYLPPETADRTATVNAADDARVWDLFDAFGIPEKSVKLIFVNGVHALPESALSDGDRVGLFPPVGGG